MVLTEEARSRRNEYYRAYRAANKERIAEINRRYWERKADAPLPLRKEKEKAENTRSDE